MGLQKLAGMLFNAFEINLISPVVDSAAQLLPKNESVHKWKVHVDKIKHLKEQFSKIAEDMQIVRAVREYMLLQFFPEGTVANMNVPKEIAGDSYEEDILINYSKYLPSIHLLKEKYPELYEVKSKFFDEIKSAKRRRKKLKEYRSENNITRLFNDFTRAIANRLDEDNWDEENFFDDYFNDGNILEGK
jgi:DNA segregation ATPase FtsK/SpoIIIE-like protein